MESIVKIIMHLLPRKHLEVVHMRNMNCFKDFLCPTWSPDPRVALLTTGGMISRSKIEMPGLK